MKKPSFNADLMNTIKMSYKSQNTVDARSELLTDKQTNSVIQYREILNETQLKLFTG